MQRCYDLHSHTIHSDGMLTPEELVLRAINKKVDVLAITDHDTTTALLPARQFIERNQLSLELINGIEISTLWNKMEIHIVGLNIDPDNSQLSSLIQQQKQRRVQRAQAIAEKLAKKGLQNAYEKTQELVQSDVISRAHFAQYLVNQQIVKDTDAAFKKYLGIGKVAYVAPQWPSIEQVVTIIHAAKGQAVLAHPSRYALTNRKLRLLLDEFKAVAGNAIEVAYARQSPAQREFLSLLSQEYRLAASQGSDFHSPEGWIELGKNIDLPLNVIPIWQTWCNSID